MSEDNEFSGSWNSFDESLSEDRDTDNQENSIVSKEYKSKDAVIILIDCNPRMFEVNEETKETNFVNVLKRVSSMLRKKIISSKRDLVGVCFYNTKKTDNPNNFPHICVYQSVDEPDATRIKQLDNLITEECKAFQEEIGSIESTDMLAAKEKEKGKNSKDNDDQLQFHQVFYVTTSMFKAKDLKDCSQRIFLFTDNDNPDNHSRDLQTRAKQKFKDLEDVDIHVELFPLNAPKRPAFEIRKFYKDVLSTYDDEDPGKLAAQFANNYQDLDEALRKKEFKKRSLASVSWELRKGLDIGVQFYALLREAKADSPSWCEAKTHHAVKVRTRKIDSSSGGVVDEKELKKYYPYGGEKVFFTKEEMKTIKTFGPPGLTLMGFKPLKRLRLWHNLKPAYFVYPDEKKIKGSTVAFHALLKEMASAKKFALCRLIYRKQGAPRFVALLPQEEEKDKNGYQVKPPGMHCVFVPYCDDIRNLKLPPTAVAGDEAVDKAKKVVRSLNILYTPETFENPSLQRHYAYLQGLALDETAEDVEKTIEDQLQPDIEGMSRFSKDIDEFVESVYGETMKEEEKGEDDDEGGEDDDEDRKPKKKRKAPEKKETKSKKVKVDASTLDFNDLIESGAIQKLTIPVLKEFLKSKRLQVSGKKADLIERIGAYLEKQKRKNASA
eukprot:TRINITY_DN7402_c0_g1_i1.p1 TRINITY_DN7402_c0_g1~~TRINITY_DN7402_c0_g1_i1.p1  ORF type:complete len:665 (+),score=195.38 TRINITY_DN7402_c0_g1_i1:67-2061(+)